MSFMLTVSLVCFGLIFFFSNHSEFASFSKGINSIMTL